MNVTLENVSVRFKDATALDQVSLDWAPGRIHGLLGRNGAGKSTLFSLIAAGRRPTSGSVRVDGQNPWERGALTEQICLVRESGDVLVDDPISDTLEMVETLRPTFDRAYADDLVDAFGLRPKSKVNTLSRGQRSTVGAIIALASRAPLTLLDEVHLGMDAPTRQRFYDELIADFAENPRTYVISSHLIAELEPIIETVTILHRGALVMQDEADDVRTQGLTLTGPAATVADLVSGLPVIGTRDLGPTRQVTVYGELDAGDLERARAAGIEVGAVPLQDLFIHLTEEDPR
ncbi:ATP-binding cassette domain-containing protein [Ornithinimicrobium pratense]|uniref:ABC transporter ATP-binding protein n=1 Tax=Ornithinimicrobium pratense TaxID=2593973 RepID=A0A5J6V4Y6_9MICO|nr:ABC transporter ATP-binding protein [Ornithinimicrobium pratense]QFG68191.1 ABC transporter ATP-binding protein [Ornithinimicrobium pratense]